MPWPGLWVFWIEAGKFGLALGLDDQLLPHFGVESRKKRRKKE